MMPKLNTTDHVSKTIHISSTVSRADIEAYLRHTWIARVTVGAHIIARNIVHELLEGLLVPRLLALAQYA